MNKDFNKINKKIASFIIVGAVAAMPLVANAFKSGSSSDVGPIDRYAGPVEINSTETSSFLPKIPNVKRYAGPIDTNREQIQKKKVKKKFGQKDNSIIARYAGPINIKPVEPIVPEVRYAGPVQIKQDIEDNSAKEISNPPKILRYAGPIRQQNY